MAILSANLTPNPPECKPFSSVAEFQQTCSINVDNGVIFIAQKATNLVIASLPIPRENEDQQSCNAQVLPHFYQGVLYFVLGSKLYKNAKYVYSFDPSKKSIEYIVAPLRNPKFFENLLVEFGKGFNLPGPQEKFYVQESVIIIYDLTRPREAREVRKHVIEGCSIGGWDGDIEKESREITAFEHETGETRSFPFSELLK
ncbi:MAG: hypothetical protein JSS10_00775 [Verrucomicrobia bacterium]|nr:hypothetical protein [Verrucomicrobiota bacterium]